MKEPQLHGFSIPFRVDPATGGIARQSGDEKLKENIVHILSTRIGERVMRRNYGAGLHDLVHDPNNDALRALAQHQIAKAIAEWEPRVQVQRIDIAQADGTMFIEVWYVVRRTAQAERVVFPLSVL